jgi:hypothetical protein
LNELRWGAALPLGCADMPRRSNVANWVENLACRPLLAIAGLGAMLEDAAGHG